MCVCWSIWLSFICHGKNSIWLVACRLNWLRREKKRRKHWCCALFLACLGNYSYWLITKLQCNGLSVHWNQLRRKSTCCREIEHEDWIIWLHRRPLYRRTVVSHDSPMRNHSFLVTPIDSTFRCAHFHTITWWTWWGIAMPHVVMWKKSKNWSSVGHPNFRAKLPNGNRIWPKEKVGGNWSNSSFNSKKQIRRFINHKVNAVNREKRISQSL